MGVSGGIHRTGSKIPKIGDILACDAISHCGTSKSMVTLNSACLIGASTNKLLVVGGAMGVSGGG